MATVNPKTNVVQADAADKSKMSKVLSSKTTYSVLGVLTALAIIVLVITATFTFMLKSNINGLGEKYREQLKNIPLVSLMLPKAIDPGDPKNLTDAQLKEKYNSLRLEKEQSLKKEAELNAQIAELTKYKANEQKVIVDSEAKQKEIDSAKLKIEADKKLLKEENAKFQALIANADKAGFKEYFQKVDKETAQKVYAEIMNEQKVSDETKKFVQIYEEMDAKATAKILEELGGNQIDLVIDMLKNMKKEKVAEILTEMPSTLAAKVSDKLAVKYLLKK